MKQKDVDQVSDHLRVYFVASFFVLLRVSIDVCFNHPTSTYIGGETDNVNADSCPTAMEEQGIILPVDEPFVLHLLRNKPPANALYFFGRKSSIQTDGGSFGRQYLGLPIC